MPGTYDRFTVNWTGEKELAEAQRVRRACVEDGVSVNALLKQLLRVWLLSRGPKEAGR